jgi:competence protein ComEA
VLAIVALAAALAILVTRAAREAEPALSDDGAYAVDPNTAPYEVVITLPGIGPTRARALIAERARGPFQSLGDLERRVPGIGPATAAAMEPYLRFEGAIAR